MDLTRQSIALPATRSRPCTGKLGHIVRVATPAKVRQYSEASRCHILVDEEQDESFLRVLLHARSTHDEMLFNGLVLGE